MTLLLDSKLLSTHLDECGAATSNDKGPLSLGRHDAPEKRCKTMGVEKKGANCAVTLPGPVVKAFRSGCSRCVFS